MDKRIGIRGQHNPELTISGYVCIPPFTTTCGLDDANLYYVVIDTFPTVDVPTEIEKLKKGLGGESKRAPAKTGNES